LPFKGFFTHASDSLIAFPRSHLYQPQQHIMSDEIEPARDDKNLAAVADVDVAEDAAHKDVQVDVHTKLCTWAIQIDGLPRADSPITVQTTVCSVGWSSDTCR
jgi:hypothetical protein